MAWNRPTLIGRVAAYALSIGTIQRESSLSGTCTMARGAHSPRRESRGNVKARAARCGRHSQTTALVARAPNHSIGTTNLQREARAARERQCALVNSAHAPGLARDLRRGQVEQRIGCTSAHRGKGLPDAGAPRSSESGNEGQRPQHAYAKPGWQTDRRRCRQLACGDSGALAKATGDPRKHCSECGLSLAPPRRVSRREHQFLPQ